MLKDYNYSLLKSILNTKINKKIVWKKRVQQQTQYIHLLEDVFGTDISKESFSFYPGRVYFATPLTSDPTYTKKMMLTWITINKALKKLQWDVYAPFLQTDPHSKNPDTLDSYQIRDLDHIQVMVAEVAMMDLNRPSHGVGQEIEMSLFMPKIGFSQTRVSRMTKGMPGLMILNYKDEKTLVKLLKDIFKREDYKSEPFYLDNCANHPTKSIFKGDICLNCTYKEHLHTS